MNFTVFGQQVTNIYTQVSPEYCILRIRQDRGLYDYLTAVDIGLVEELRNFVWYHQHTANGIYFGTSVTITTKRHLDRLQVCQEVKDTLLLHRFIAFMAIPNTNDPAVYRYVDHISRNTLDNRVVNLRWASQADQNVNQNKRPRQIQARALPADIPLPLPKFVNWNVETYAPGKTRCFFRVECHPGLPNGKPWSTSKSNQVSNVEKLEQAKQKLIELDQLVDPDPEVNLRARLNAEFDDLIALMP